MTGNFGNLLCTFLKGVQIYLTISYLTCILLFFTRHSLLIFVMLNDLLLAWTKAIGTIS